MTPLASIRDLRIGAVTDAGREVEIIRGVSLDVAPGEVVALIGESGSGKTTIALSLMGYTRPGCRIESGAVLLDGTDVVGLSPRARAAIRGRTVAYVPQSAAAAFNPSKRLMDQVIEVARIHRLMPPEAARRKAVDLFRALALPDPDTIGDRYPHQVSGGQLQRLSAAMALIGDPRLIIFDEPTTALDVTTQIEVLRAFKSVIRGGAMAGVYVSHDLAVVAQIADRIVVLKDGEVQEEGTSDQIINAPAHPYTRELIAAFEPRSGAVTPGSDVEPAPVLEVRDLTAGYGGIGADGLPRVPVLRDVALRLLPGRNLGVIGESGSGKSTLARCIAGLLPPARGTISLAGRTLAPGTHGRSKDDLRRVQIVFQLADTALNPNRPVGRIVGRPVTFYHGLHGAELEARVDALLDMVRLPRAMKYRLPGELSGGQKQRVNLARALAAEPELILCDEVTSALDTVVAAAVLDLLRELQRELGLSYLFISHDLSTVEAICDDVMVMYQGETVERMAAARMRVGAEHPYSRLLISSVPRLDTGWLDGLEQDAELVAQFARR
ncbi:MAG: ABC transporter ATP-binding protein [Ectothiorhodospiraceae bacterium]|nr:ABC transporter ATP-binding protein [Ectothiorhodospiraceae bacterium]